MRLLRVCGGVGLALLVTALLGCAAWPPASWIGQERELSGEVYRPDRRSYATFRLAHPELIDPNYLPFMVHRLPGGPVLGDELVFCRWPDASMPLDVYVAVPELPDSLQDEFHLRRPEEYAAAAERALTIWEDALEGLVRFRRVQRPEDAALELRMLGRAAPAPEPEIRVLGATVALLGACHPHGWDPDAERLKVSFAVSELVVYVADDFGLLTPTQVERIVLHELGHALGMSGHSPIPGDLMFRMLQERAGTASLSLSDVNSFVSLYRLPNGAHYEHVRPGGDPEKLRPEPPSSPPVLAMAPHVDTRAGYDIKTPVGWLRLETPRGLYASNGPLWDHDASIEVAVWPYASVDAYLERFGPFLFDGTWLRSRGRLVFKGRDARLVRVEDADGRHAQDFLFIQLDDERVMMILTECPVEVASEWRPWFEASLESLEFWSLGGIDSSATGEH